MSAQPIEEAAREVWRQRAGLAESRGPEATVTAEVLGSVVGSPRGGKPEAGE